MGEQDLPSEGWIWMSNKRGVVNIFGIKLYREGRGGFASLYNGKSKKGDDYTFVPNQFFHSEEKAIEKLLLYTREQEVKVQRTLENLVNVNASLTWRLEELQGGLPTSPRK